MTCQSMWGKKNGTASLCSKVTYIENVYQFLSFFWDVPPAPFAKPLEPGLASGVIGIVEGGKMLLAQPVAAGPPARGCLHHTIVLHHFVQGICYEPVACYVGMDLVEQPFVAGNPVRCVLLGKPPDIDKRYLVPTCFFVDDLVHGFEYPQRADVLFLCLNEPLLRLRKPADMLVALAEQKEKARMSAVDSGGLLEETELLISLRPVEFSSLFAQLVYLFYLFL